MYHRDLVPRRYIDTPIDRKRKLLLQLRHVGTRQTRTVGPCTVARAYVAAPDVPLSPSRALQYQKIAALDLAWQRQLDALGASFRQVRWVSGPGPGNRRTEVDLRYRALVKLLEGKSEHATFRDLCDAHPTYDPHTGEEIPPARPQKGHP